MISKVSPLLFSANISYFGSPSRCKYTLLQNLFLVLPGLIRVIKFDTLQHFSQVSRLWIRSSALNCLLQFLIAQIHPRNTLTWYDFVLPCALHWLNVGLPFWLYLAKVHWSVVEWPAMHWFNSTWSFRESSFLLFMYLCLAKFPRSFLASLLLFFSAAVVAWRKTGCMERNWLLGNRSQRFSSDPVSFLIPIKTKMGWYPHYPC